MSARTLALAARIEEQIAAGSPGAVARAISYCENDESAMEHLLGVLPERTAPIVGLTGPPGAGKSTLVNALIKAYGSKGCSVGVLAVDPSSPLSGGALLGDRVRLDPVDGQRVFFRSLASRGAPGGLCDAARSSAQVLSAAGFDVILLETVGSGQSDLRVMRVADTIAVVLTPGAGDIMQALKAGIMDIADVFVLNKCDVPGSGELKAQVAAAVSLRDSGDWVPPLIPTNATQSDGVDELIDAFVAHGEYLQSDIGQERRRLAKHAEVMRLATSAFTSALLEEAGGVGIEELGEQAAARILAQRAAERLLSLTPGRGDA